ncbi:hypothetical protein SK128_010372 [Halocaridina rubra]|uniref:Uncharacterized protein n=1 Tax=Halocaridina rubra TaxID=373956 RepID=A0AAN8ZWU9_HALRR
MKWQYPIICALTVLQMSEGIIYFSPFPGFEQLFLHSAAAAGLVGLAVFETSIALGFIDLAGLAEEEEPLLGGEKDMASTMGMLDKPSDMAAMGTMKNPADMANMPMVDKPSMVSMGMRDKPIGMETMNMVMPESPDNKPKRSIDHNQMFDNLLDQMLAFVKRIDRRGCVQKTVCYLQTKSPKTLSPVERAIVETFSEENQELLTESSASFFYAAGIGRQTGFPMCNEYFVRCPLQETHLDDILSKAWGCRL